MSCSVAHHARALVVFGRGKIRSLREHHVHVETDANAGDLRNLLLLKYVEFLGRVGAAHLSLRKRASLSSQRADPRRNLSRHGDLDRGHQRIVPPPSPVQCARPDNRLLATLDSSARGGRFVMAGVEYDVEVPGADPALMPEWCLSLSTLLPVPLRAALSGLPTTFCPR